MTSAGGMTRREWLVAMAAASLSVPRLTLAAQTTSKISPSKFGMPGLLPGRVVAVSHPGSIIGDQFQREPIRKMIEEGMLDLTEAPDVTAAWRLFFEKGDVVGIKLTPVGHQFSRSFTGDHSRRGIGWRAAKGHCRLRPL
jgi:hypothetical protein